MKNYLILIIAFGLASPASAQQFILDSGSPFDTLSASYQSLSWIDYDGDGLDDLFATQETEGQRLFHNDGGTFSHVTSAPFDTMTTFSQSACWADYDNDGWSDVYITQLHGYNAFFKNEGGEFVQNLSSGTTDVYDETRSCSWADYNNDGLLDLFVVNRVGRNYLYVNLGSGSFSSVEEEPFTTDDYQSVTASWVDYDNDGDVDLFVTNIFRQPDQLYSNVDGSFSVMSLATAFQDTLDSASASWADYDNDGDQDVFVARVNDFDNTLFINTGETFLPVTVGSGGDSIGSTWADYDNDGDLDLFVANRQLENDQLFQNDGDSGLIEVRNEPFLIGQSFSTGSAWGDKDNDGNLDLAVATKDGNIQIFSNLGNGNHWIGIDLVGGESNQDGYGAKIQVQTGGETSSTWQFREKSQRSGHYSQNHSLVHFGIGSETLVDSIVVTWPSGLVSTLAAVNSDAIIRIDEPIKLSVTTGQPGFDIVISELYPNPSSTESSFRLNVSTSQQVVGRLYSVDGRLVATVLDVFMASGSPITGTIDVASLASGVYILTFQGNTFLKTRKLTVIR